MRPVVAAPRPARPAGPARRARRWRAAALGVALVALAPACAAGGDATGTAAAGRTATTPPGPVGTVAPAGSTATTGTAPPPTAPAWAATTTTVGPVAPGGPCPTAGGATPPAPTRPDDAAAARDRLAPALEQLRQAGGSVGVSVHVDGVGEVAALDPTVPLVPASNQKLLVAFAALDLLPPDPPFTTTVVATGPVVDGVVQGDLVLVGGGDPTLTRSGPHSLDTLAAEVRAAGITGVGGDLVVDESRYDPVRTGSGWVDGAWQQSNVGLLSSVVVDRNRGWADPAFALDPPLAHLHAFREALLTAGVAVAGADRTGPGRGSAGQQVAALPSPPLAELVTALLSRSDNLAAELLVKELGRRAGGEGSAPAGLAAARSAAAARCVALDGADADGSGLSRADARSPDAWRRLLDAARTRPWFPAFRDALAVSGQTGTLATRLGGPATAGRVRAKTGSTAVAGALSGYLTAASGATVVFSVVVNAPRGAPEPAIDAFVTALATEL